MNEIVPAKTLKDVRREYAMKKSASHPVQNLLADDEYIERRAARLKLDEVQARKHRGNIIEGNLNLWSRSISSRWKDAKVEDSIMPPENKENLLKHVERWQAPQGERRHTSFMFTGFSGRGKTWTSYAYMHELIRSGTVTPQQICVLAESRLSSIAASGFERPSRMKELLDPKYQVYFVDEVGRGIFKNGAERGMIWFELIDHIYSNQLCLILTTNLVTEDVEKWFGAASTDRLRALVGSDGYVPFVQDRNMRQELGQYGNAKA